MPVLRFADHSHVRKVPLNIRLDGAIPVGLGSLRYPVLIAGINS